MQEGAAAVDRRDIVVRTGRIFLFSAAVGCVSGVLCALFLAVFGIGQHALWETFVGERLHDSPLATIGVVMTAALIVGLLRRRVRIDTASPEVQFAATGVVSYKHFFSTLWLALTSLFSGASVGPEGGLGDLCAQLGTRVAQWLKVGVLMTRIFIFAAVAAAFSAVVGSPVFGTFLVMDMYQYRKYDYDTWVIPGLVAGSFAFIVYWFIIGEPSFQVFNFPDYTTPSFADLAGALAFGVVGVAAGLAFGLVHKGAGAVFGRMADMPVWRALAGGLIIAGALLVLPIVAFSGHHEIATLMDEAGTTSILVLFVICIGKMVLTAASFATGFKGGPIFPLIFMGATAGFLVHALLPFATVPVVVIAVATGFITTALRSPVTAILFMIFISDLIFSPVIIVAAVAAYGTLIISTPLEHRTALLRLIPS